MTPRKLFHDADKISWRRIWTHDGAKIISWRRNAFHDAKIFSWRRKAFHDAEKIIEWRRKWFHDAEKVDFLDDQYSTGLLPLPLSASLHHLRIQQPNKARLCWYFCKGSDSPKNYGSHQIKVISIAHVSLVRSAYSADLEIKPARQVVDCQP